MAQNDDGPAVLTAEGLARLLQSGDCPAGYKCMAMDCLDCIQIHMDQGGGNDAEAD